MYIDPWTTVHDSYFIIVHASTEWLYSPLSSYRCSLLSKLCGPVRLVENGVMSSSLVVPPDYAHEARDASSIQIVCGSTADAVEEGRIIFRNLFVGNAREKTNSLLSQ